MQHRVVQLAIGPFSALFTFRPLLAQKQAPSTGKGSVPRTFEGTFQQDPDLAACETRDARRSRQRVDKRILLDPTPPPHRGFTFLGGLTGQPSWGWLAVHDLCHS